MADPELDRMLAEMAAEENPELDADLWRSVADSERRSREEVERKLAAKTNADRSRDDSGRFATQKSPEDLRVELEELKAAIPGVEAKYGRDSEHAARIRQAYEAKFRQHYETRSKVPAQTFGDYERLEMDAMPAFLAETRAGGGPDHRGR